MTVPKGHRRIEGSERQPALGARRVRPADPNEHLSVSVHLRRPPGAPRLPDLAHWAATPLGRRRFLTRAEFAAQQGAAPADLEKIAAFSRAHGLTVTESSAARRTVVLSGTVAQMDAAFGVSLGQYQSPTESYRGREGFVHVPEDIHAIVESVLGLDNRRIARHYVASGGVAQPGSALAPAGDPGGASPLTPLQVAKLYNFPANAAAGQTIAIIELGGGFAQADINAFFNGLGLVAPTLAVVSVDGATNAPAGDISNVTTDNPDVEVVLDIDVAGAIAQGAAIAVYFGPQTSQGFADAVKAAVHDAVNAPSILSISWSIPEDSISLAGRITVGNALLDAAAVGVTVFAASGDWGSDCRIGDGRAHVLYPASDPAVTACGGTFIANVSGSTFSEGTWNDSFGATGGGVSDVFGLPSW
jgi:kumamolisin